MPTTRGKGRGGANGNPMDAVLDDSVEKRGAAKRRPARKTGGKAAPGGRSARKVVRRRRIRPRAYVILALVLLASVAAGLYVAGVLPGQDAGRTNPKVERAGADSAPVVRTVDRSFMRMVDKANGLYDSRRFEEAIHWYEKALAIRPDDAAVLVDIGTCNFYRGSETKALGYYGKALAVEPSNPNALFNKGIVLKRMGRYDESREALRAYLRTNPSEADAARVRDMISGLE